MTALFAALYSLWDRAFDPQAPFWKKYRALFSIHEIEGSTMLQWFCGAAIFYFYETFASWVHSPVITAHFAQAGQAICPSYFPWCTGLYFLQYLPYGYSQTILYMAFFGIMALAAYWMYKRRWHAVHMCIMVLFAWKTLVMFVFTSLIPGGANYHDFFLLSVLLFVPYKEYFLQLTLVMLYFVSTVIKINDTWVAGTYFTTLQTGLPLFGNAVAPFLTNLVVFMEVVGSWLLMSSNKLLQRTVLFFFIAFHLYSGILVTYHYPAHVLPALLILFGPLFRPRDPPVDRRSLTGWGIILILVLCQVIGPIIPGDQRYTREGSQFGLNLFDGNHQCVETYKVYRSVSQPIASSSSHLPRNNSCGDLECETETSTYMENGMAVSEHRIESAISWQRCSPRDHWQVLVNAYCGKRGVVRVAMTFDDSLNGGPFYRIVDQPDVCSLVHLPLSRADWVLSPPEAPIVGYPVKNVFHYAGEGIRLFNTSRTTASSTLGLIVLHELAGNDPVTYSPLQSFILRHLGIFTGVWYAIGCVVAFFVLRRLYRALRHHRGARRKQ